MIKIIERNRRHDTESEAILQWGKGLHMNALPGRPLALVTGAGRRQGIGAAICRALAEADHDIFFTHWQSYDQSTPWGADDVGPTMLEEELRAMGVCCTSMEVDLSLSESPMRVLDAAQAFGALTVVVNNAAYSTQTNVDTLDTASLDAHYAVNVRAAALLSVEFARRFHGENGRIINLTSGQSLGPMPDELAYAMSKGAIEIFTRSLAPAIMARGITINAVNPGPTDTGWMTDEVKRELLPRFPAGRLGQPDDVARLVAFLASPAAQWITGQIIHSEGGFMPVRRHELSWLFGALFTINGCPKVVIRAGWLAHDRASLLPCRAHVNETLHAFSCRSTCWQACCEDTCP